MIKKTAAHSHSLLFLWWREARRRWIWCKYPGRLNTFEERTYESPIQTISHGFSIIPCCRGGCGFFPFWTYICFCVSSLLIVVHGEALKYLLVFLRGSRVKLFSSYGLANVVRTKKMKSALYLYSVFWFMQFDLCYCCVWAHQSFSRLDVGDVHLLQTGHVTL